MSASSSPTDLTADRTIPVIDARAALERMAGDEKLYRELARFFLEDSPVLLAEVESALAGRDLEAAARPAHSLKGIAANLGGLRLETAARILEEHVLAGRRQEARAAAVLLASESQRLAESLRNDVLD